MEDLDGGLLLRQQCTYSLGQIELTFHGVTGYFLRQECGEASFQFFQEAGGVAPHVHGYGSQFRHIGPGGTAVFCKVDTAGILLYLGAFCDVSQVTLFVYNTHASCDAAMVGNRVAQLITHHAVIVNVLVLGAAQIVVKNPECGLAVVIVGINNGKGSTVDGILGTQNRMASAPGLGAAFGDYKAFRNFVQFLVGIADLHGAAFQALANNGKKIFTNGIFDDDHNGAETGFIGIVNRIIQDCFTVRTHGINLLQTTVATTHPGGHHDLNRLFHSKHLLINVVFMPNRRIL